MRAQVGGAAVLWNALLGAAASTRGEWIAFTARPSLGEAAHEAAHVVQQRQGASPPGGLSRADDAWERNADAIAARVARHEPAGDLIGEPAPPVRDTDPLPVQRRLIAHGSDAHIARFFALAEPAGGMELYRDPASHVVTAIATLAAGGTSAHFAAILTFIMEDTQVDAEAQFGEHQPGVVVGAYPDRAPLVQRIDLDDVEKVETDARGRGVALLAHELHENFVAHTLTVGRASLPEAHRIANYIEGDVSEDLVGPGPELLDYRVIKSTTREALIEDYGTYFVIIDYRREPASPLTGPNDWMVTRTRNVPQTVLSTVTVDGFPTGSDVVPPSAAPAVSAATALLAAFDTAAVHVEGYTDDVGSAADNLDLGQRRADKGRDLFPKNLRERRVAAVGHGETRFAAPNTSGADRARNRRIVITVVSP
ncbi:OmpA family protein [Streptomyces sp. NPDC008196]|uniref:OmpA family protein n=1 Tax=Streptomyces sp. NPDC008196 TaxID=3364819 RepID=UPI0036F05710